MTREVKESRPDMLFAWLRLKSAIRDLVPEHEELRRHMHRKAAMLLAQGKDGEAIEILEDIKRLDAKQLKGPE